MTTVLDFQNIKKTYQNGKTALKGVSLQVKQNEFLALLGPNGAGKTTLINTLAGNVIKNSGKIYVDNIDFDEDELALKKLVGIVPQELNFDSFFTVNEVLKNQSGYFGIKDNQAYIDEILKELSLYDKKDTNTKALSGGMKRRLLIAKSIIHKPEIIILDEPTAGVDIELRQSLYKFLKKLHKQGKTIILTTHYLEEAEILCDRIVVINKGEIVADDTKENLKTSLGSPVTLKIKFDNLAKIDFSFLKDYDYERKEEHLEIKTRKKELYTIFHKLVHRNIKFKSFDMHEANLEDVFLDLTK
jgi:ABC-2 type transport system ATP-binding protein